MRFLLAIWHLTGRARPSAVVGLRGKKRKKRGGLGIENELCENGMYTFSVTMPHFEFLFKCLKFKSDSLIG